jgi:hypothetical protein
LRCCEGRRVCMGFDGLGEGVEGCVDGAYLWFFCEYGLWLEGKEGAYAGTNGEERRERSLYYGSDLAEINWECSTL